MSSGIEPPAKRRPGGQPRPIPEGSTPEAEQAMKALNFARNDITRGQGTSEQLRAAWKFAMSFPSNKIEARIRNTKKQKRYRDKLKLAKSLAKR